MNSFGHKFLRMSFTKSSRFSKTGSNVRFAKFSKFSKSFDQMKLHGTKFKLQVRMFTALPAKHILGKANF